MYSAYLVLFGVLPVRICMLSLWSFLHIGVGFWRCLFNFDRQCKSLSVWNGQPTIPRFFVLLNII